MKVEEELRKLEKRVDSFTIRGPLVSGSFKTGFVIGGSSAGDAPIIPLEDNASPEARISRLETHFDKFNIDGSNLVNVAGNIDTGFAINIKR